MIVVALLAVILGIAFLATFDDRDRRRAEALERAERRRILAELDRHGDRIEP